MKTSHHFLRVCIVFAAGLFLSCSSSDDRNNGPGEIITPPSTAEWTVLFYGAGNNAEDLLSDGRSAVISAVHELEQVLPIPQVQAVACVGSQQTNGQSGLYEIDFRPGDANSTVSSTRIADWGTRDLSDPATLEEFLLWGTEHYPANKFVLVFAGKGHGWKGAFDDVINGSGESMPLAGIKSAMLAASSNLPEGRFEIVQWYSANMATIETVYELSNITNRLMTTPWKMNGVFPRDMGVWYLDLCSNPLMSSAELCNRMGDAAIQTANYYGTSARHVVFDLTVAGSVANKLEGFADELTTIAEENADIVKSLRDSSWVAETDDSNHVDLSLFVDKLLQSNLTLGGAELTMASEELQTAIDDMILEDVNSIGEDTRQGLMIYFPSVMDSTEILMYSNVSLSQSVSGWKTCLEMLSASVGQQITVSGTVVWAGHTLENIGLFLNSAQFGVPQIYLQVPVTLIPTSDPDSAGFQVTFSLGADSLATYVGLYADRDASNTATTGDRIGYVRTPPSLRDWMTLYPGSSIENASVNLSYNF